IANAGGPPGGGGRGARDNALPPPVGHPAAGEGARAPRRRGRPGGRRVRPAGAACRSDSRQGDRATHREKSGVVEKSFTRRADSPYTDRSSNVSICKG